MTPTTPYESLSVHITLRADPSKVDEFLQAMRPTFEAVIAEPRNLFCELYRDGETPGVFKLIENWDADIDYMLNVQVKKDYYKPMHEAAQKFLLNPPEPKFYKRMGDSWVSVKKDRFPEQAA